jgi:hypothetical protein
MEGRQQKGMTQERKSKRRMSVWRNSTAEEPFAYSSLWYNRHGLFFSVKNSEFSSAFFVILFLIAKKLQLCQGYLDSQAS